MRITQDRKTALNDLVLRQPVKFTPANGDIKNDKRPLRFTSPLYSPLTPDRLALVHPEGSKTTGGFFGPTRKHADGTAKMHRGLDIGASNETGNEDRVMAAEDGRVARIGYDKDGYGHYIDIEHRGGYLTKYAHLKEVGVVEGQTVAQGELIGKTGKSGNADSANVLPHLHFEIRQDGVATDPLPYLTELPPDRKLFLMIEGLPSPVANSLSIRSEDE